MIFTTISKVTEKDSFLEKLNVYTRLVEVTAERFKLSVPISCFSDDSLIGELIDMGVVSGKEDLALLKRLLGEDYVRFISSVKFYLANRHLFGNVLDKLHNKKRAYLQRDILRSSKPCFVDLFAGAGGLSCGFSQAGFRVCFANDFEDVCVRTYQFNHPELSATRVLKCDIREIVDNVDRYVDEDVDVVVGGPPCQGFSPANQQRIIDDPRNELYKYYVKAVSKILPKFVVMENVRGMLSVADQVVEDYGNIKEIRKGKTFTYEIEYDLLNSLDFSVAQNRERLIYIAIRSDISENKGITPKDLFYAIRAANANKPHYLLKDALEAIKPLEAPRVKNRTDLDSDKTGKRIDVNLFNGDENPYLSLINEGRKQPYLYNHKARYLNDVNYEIYRLLDQGNDASDPKIASIMPYANRLHCFKDKYYKLIADSPSRTITAHLRMDCHSHIHPYQIRAITPREAARCQSFPDDYLFLGAYLKTYMQIGNAVPCLMAKGIAEVIKRFVA